MAQQGAALQNYNNELVKCLEDLCQRRQRLQKEIDQETVQLKQVEQEEATIEWFLDQFLFKVGVDVGTNLPDILLIHCCNFVRLFLVVPFWLIFFNFF